MRSLLHVACAFALLCPIVLQAENACENPAAEQDCGIEVVVSASRVEVPRETVSASCSVLEADTVERRQQQSLAEAVSALPSVDLVQSGGPGGNISIGLRGANNEHSLVLIDGMEANNPGTPAGTCNFADLAALNVQRMEVLRGPQSVLYGSSALGGVVNIISRRGEETPVKNFSFEGGSYGTFRETASAAGAGKDYDYSLGLYREDTDGFSAARRADGNTEKDGHSNSSFSSRLGADINDELKAKLVLRALDARTELDNAGGAGADDVNRLAENQQAFGRFELEAQYLPELKQLLGVSMSDHYYEDNNDPDFAHPFDLTRSDYSGRQIKVDFQNQIRASEWLDLVAGFENKEDSAESSFYSESAWGPYESDFDERSTTQNAWYLQARAEALQSFSLNSGMRYSEHSKAGSSSVWQGGAVWRLDESDTRFTANIGTGFKAPSLFQLYSIYGDENLKAEKSLGLDAGFEQKLGQRVKLGETFFYNRFRELISFDPGSFLYSNISRAVTQGMETSLSLELAESLRLEGSYTYLDAQDTELDEPLLRRARHRTAAWLDWDVDQSLMLTCGFKFAGSRYDTDYSAWPAERVSLASYATLMLGAEYRLDENWSVFARGENLLDRDYEEVSGYGVAGASLYAGVKYRG